MHPQAFIFDLDGTLVDSLHDIADALNRALRDHALPEAPVEMVRGWVGNGLRALCREACGAAAPDDVEGVVKSALTHYRSRVVARTCLYPNIMQMLELLKAGGARMAVLSNKPHDLTVEVIRQLGIHSFFTDVRGPDTEETRKPAPQGIWSILAGLRVAPNDAFMIGDSAIDIQTARNSGAKSVAVTWGFRPVEELFSAGPDFLVEDPLEIPHLLKKN